MREPALSETLLRAQEQPPAVRQFRRAGGPGPEAGLLPEEPPDQPALMLPCVGHSWTFHSNLTSLSVDRSLVRGQDPAQERSNGWQRKIPSTQQHFRGEKPCPKMSGPGLPAAKQAFLPPTSYLFGRQLSSSFPEP